MTETYERLKAAVTEKLGTADDGALEDLHYPRHLLILSADIVGSTALKQSAGFSPHALETVLTNGSLSEHQKRDEVEKIEKWFDVLRYFYTASSAQFSQAFDHASNQGDSADYGSSPVLWKTVGDEVLFYKNVTKQLQIANTIMAWQEAIHTLRIGLKLFEQRLDVKCTAWLAEFPVENKILTAPSPSEGGTSACSIASKFDDKMRACNGDFVGPSIDIGFRLATMSTARKFMISLDVAYFLASVSNDDIQIHYDGRQYFKGVAGGVAYPTFWIDMGDDDALDQFEDKLLQKNLCPDKTVKQFCEKFYADKDNPSFAPILFGTKIPKGLTLSESYVEAYSIIVPDHSGACGEC